MRISEDIRPLALAISEFMKASDTVYSQIVGQ